MAACDKCFWGAQCFSPGECNHFTPLEDSDNYIDEMIEENRVNFYKDWFEGHDLAE